MTQRTVMPSKLADTQPLRISEIFATSTSHLLSHPQPQEADLTEGVTEKGSKVEEASLRM